MSKMCSICQLNIEEGETTQVCNKCQCEFHLACWQDNDGCATPGCENVPKPLKREGGLPENYTYFTETTKTCPACGETIKITELSCPHCNESFDSIEPVNQDDFRKRLIGQPPEVPGKKEAILIFIGGLIGCLAPFNLVIGGLWFLQNRVILREASALYHMLAALGLGISLFYCIIWVLILLVKR